MFIRYFHMKKRHTATNHFTGERIVISYVNSNPVFITEDTQCTLVADVSTASEGAVPTIMVGYAVFNPKDKAFSKKVGKEIAMSKMVDARTIDMDSLPNAVKPYFRPFINEVILSVEKDKYLK